MTWKLILGDCLEGMRAMPDKSVDVILDDPPYSAHVHGCARRANTGYSGDGSKSANSRNRYLGFSHLSASEMNALAAQYARIARRWVGVFSDTESDHLWRGALKKHGLEYIRTAFWHKIGSTPQFTGDRPAVAVEAITLCHPKGRKRWNGGGKHGLYPCNIVLDRWGTESNDRRMHPTQKPMDLMRALVSDFTNPGELVLDSHAGSGTTGAACIELGRNFIGFEKDPKHHATATSRLERCVVDSAALHRQGLLALPKMKQQNLL